MGGGMEMGGPGPRMDLHGPDMNNGGGSRSGMGGMPGRSAMDPMARMGMPPQDEPRGPPRDPRSRDPRDRGNMGGGGGGMSRGGSMSRGGPGGPGGPNMRPGPGGPPGGGGAPLNNLAGEDPEKAQLIMQVLQLTDEQIAVLPAEQRQSIMVLKEQIKQHGGPMM